MDIIEVTDCRGALLAPEWLPHAEGVHRQLRPDMPKDYAGRLKEIFLQGGCMSLVAEDSVVRALAIWRVIENTYEGRRLYIDDLVSDEAYRSQGFGQRLLAFLEDKARQLSCNVLALDSGVQRQGAHRFYFREGFHIPSFCFRKVLK